MEPTTIWNTWEKGKRERLKTGSEKLSKCERKMLGWWGGGDKGLAVFPDVAVVCWFFTALRITAFTLQLKNSHCYNLFSWSAPSNIVFPEKSSFLVPCLCKSCPISSYISSSWYLFLNFLLPRKPVFSQSINDVVVCIPICLDSYNIQDWQKVSHVVQQHRHEASMNKIDFMMDVTAKKRQIKNIGCLHTRSENNTT